MAHDPNPLELAAAWRSEGRRVALATVWSSIHIALLGTLCVAHAADDVAPVTQAGATSDTQELNVAGVKVRLEFLDQDFRNGTAQLVVWIERSIAIVAGYYGRFPTAELRLQVHSTGGSGVRHGTAFGSSTPRIRLQVGREATAAELMRDWVLVHEMVHLALPEVGRKHAWLSEGLATYVEGIARVQAGNRSAKDVWAEYVDSMPQGLPRSGDEGLDNTHTWGRTYWGGALFCLQADVEIRKRTNNRFGLQDALRAVAKSSGGLSFDWSIERVFATGDAAVSTTVLTDLYARMKDAPAAPHLDALWKDMGIQRRGASVELHDDAPLAAIRDAIARAPDQDRSTGIR